MLVSLDRSVVSDLKRELSRIFPTARSAHLSEALARGLGFETHAVLLSRVPEVGNISAFARPGYQERSRARAAAVSDADLIAFMASTGFRGVSAAPRQPDVWTSGVTADVQRPLLQAVLRCGNLLAEPEPETAGEQVLLRLATGARTARVAAKRGELRMSGTIHFRTTRFQVELTVLPTGPTQESDDVLIHGFLSSDLATLTRLSERVAWSHDLYPQLRAGFMADAAPPTRFSHFEAGTGSSLVVWDTAAAILDVKATSYPNRDTFRLTPELRHRIDQAWSGPGGNKERVSAIRDIVLGAEPWEPRDRTGRDGDRITWPYRKVSGDEGIFITGVRGSFGLSRHRLVVSVIPRQGFTARQEGRTKDLASGRGPAGYSALLEVLRDRCHAARAAIRDDVMDGTLQPSSRGTVESLEELAAACSGSLRRYDEQAAAGIPGLVVDCDELAAVVRQDLDVWLRSGGVPRQGHSSGIARVVTPDFRAAGFVSAVDGSGVAGIGALLAEDAEARARSAAHDDTPDFGNVVADIQGTAGDIMSLLEVLRRHQRVVTTLRGFLFDGRKASVALDMVGSAYMQTMKVEMPYDGTVAMVDSLTAGTGMVPSDGGRLNFRWTVPGPREPGDVTAIRAMQEVRPSRGWRFMATSLIHGV